MDGRDGPLTVPGYKLDILLHDAFGAVIGRGVLEIDKQVYAVPADDPTNVAEIQKSMRLGMYVRLTPGEKMHIPHYIEVVDRGEK